MTLDDLQHIKKWHMAHRLDHPVEYHAWDMMLTLWVIGWVGMLPAGAFGVLWTMPLCAVAAAAPTLYAAWRVKAHRQGRLRCDWIAAIPRR
jgi:hypothetical protein